MMNIMNINIIMLISILNMVFISTTVQMHTHTFSLVLGSGQPLKRDSICCNVFLGFDITSNALELHGYSLPSSKMGSTRMLSLTMVQLTMIELCCGGSYGTIDIMLKIAVRSTNFVEQFYCTSITLLTPGYIFQIKHFLCNSVFSNLKMHQVLAYHQPGKIRAL